MKLTKKILSFLLCILMLVTSIYNDGWSFVYEQLTASAMAGHEQSYNDTRVELDFNKNWLFSFTDDESAYMKGFDDSDWQSVDLPHDFSISQDFTTEGTEPESGRLPGGTGWYRKWFNLYEYYTGDRVFLNFDGVYQHTYVYVNGKFVGENHYGYNSFSFEISDYLIHTNTAHNVIAVKVVNDLPNSRWYSGSGIYRDVTLTIAGPVHVALYGPRITTPDLHNAEKAHANVSVKMHNDTAISKIVTVEATVLDKNHNAVSDTVVYDKLTIPAETEKEITLAPEVENPTEWSIENPELYKLRTIVKDYNTGEILDEYHTTFGFRCMEWDADGGFMLNHKPVKLKGVCLHNDQGALGAAQEYEAIYRQVATLKDMGCNAIRTTHNPSSKALIEICNELGMLVIVEFFDGWDASKNHNENDFSKYFNEEIADTNTAIGAGGQKWFQYVVEHAILRDEHDPCVIAWDIGNELCNITDGSQTGNYEEIVKSITNIVDNLDPSRVVMQGNNKPDRNNPDNAAVTMIDEHMDVIGGNYAPAAWTYVMNDASDPRSSKPFVATEAASAINSRGVYYTMGSDDASMQCTAYDTNAVSWGNEAAEAWYYTITNDWFSGEFIWTGFDYIGEPTPWDNIVTTNNEVVPVSSYFGVVDTAGFKKDSYYLYRSWWNNDSTTLHLVPGSWNQDKLNVTNGYVPVAVYSNAAKIELLLNGQVIATATSADIASGGGLYTYKSWTESVVNSSKCNTQQFYNDAGSDLYAQFYVKHEAGTLSVKAYDKNNNEITDTTGSVKSVSGTASQVAATVWNNENLFVADSTDYIYVEYEARDAYGNFMNDYNGTLSIKVDDSSARYAKIIGVDNGNPATTEKFQQKSVIISDSEAEIQMFNGRALVILRTTDEEGTINITATASDGTTSFSTEGITVTSTTESGIELTDEFEEVIRQNDTEYQVTLYDEYEVVKYHINKLEKPGEGSGSSGDSGDSGDSGNDGEEEDSNKYHIYLADSSKASGCVEEGYYIINNRNFVLSEESYGGWSIATDLNITDAKASPDGAEYRFKSFNTSDENLYEFIHQGGNQYYIRNVSTQNYISYNKSTWSTVFDTEPHLFTIIAKENGSIQIYSEPGVYIDGRHGSYFNGFSIYEAAENPEYSLVWLYSEPKETPPSSEVDENAPYEIYFAKQSSEGILKDGDYVISSGGFLMSSDLYYGWTLATTKDIDDVQAADGTPYVYQSFNTSDENVYTFTHQGNNKYYIQNKQTKEYLYINASWAPDLGETPHLFTVQANADGSVLISENSKGFYLYLIRQYEQNYNYGELSEYANLWLYSKPYKTSESKIELYNALLDGIDENYSLFTRESFENLLRKLEEGVQVYSAENSTDADYTAAAKAIREAIDALKMDIKQINGTLFKYGYNNSGDTPDYSDGGTLMNSISISTMKNAILADSNLVRQIKDIIGYDTRTWAPGYADAALDEVAGIYAAIYSLQFTGKPYDGSDIKNSASFGNPQDSYTTVPVMTLWNIYTKENTRGENDPTLDWDGPHEVYDGASVQGLAGSTLENGVVTSHSAYDIPLSYSNDGHNYENGTEPTDVGLYKYFVATDVNNQWNEVTLPYLEGISVYFPDLFTRENLDADGNVTTATTGRFAKYYWDAEFPIFISTDEYGVNTYYFNSSDPTHLVQGSFDDENQTVDMQLNEVDSWKAIGPNSGSGFFPFNYQQGATDLTSEHAIYHYGFTFEHNFYIPKGGKHANGDDVIFNFSGDDDVLVYIDGVLVLDNGGLHGARGVTINFTNCTINYQFAMDIADTETGVDGASYAKLKGGEYECTYSYNKLVENHPDAAGYNADTVAALNKLHEVISDGQVHTLNFFYLERGASDSNCHMSFNLSETSEEVRIIDQTLTLDYAHPVEYNIEDNNNISQAAIDNNVTVEYLGLCAVNEDVNSTYTFELPEIIVPFEENKTYTVDGMKYGTCTIDKEGNTSYTLNSMNMTEAEHFYVCAKITGDPTYAANVVYYQIEKTTFVPATSIYYEDTFDAITYTPGKVPTNYNNSENKFGIWQTKGMQETTLKQSADLTDSEANPYGYEENYLSFAEYSGGSSHFVDVSTRNNPNSKYSGGQGAAWPTVDFTFTGTGFDLISVSDCTTGVFNVVIKDKDNKTVRNHVVDTFYGYNYGQIYMDANGNPTFEASQTKPLYRSEEGHYTPAVKYYDENGAITDTPHYYDAVGSITENESDSPAYAYAFGWLLAEDGSTDTLYQIPVIKVTDLEYGSYSVKITPTFTSMFGHSETAKDGSSYYRLYLDAIKIFSPAGENDNIKDKDVKDAYATDDELYPSYIELKDMLIGADTLSDPDSEGQGIIFIDGIAALDNNLGTYKNAGPNNELYLAKDQAVAFEIWATAVPTDIQIGAKLACGKPALTVSYASKATEIKIGTATDIYYSFNSALPNDSKLTWQQITAADGNNYYTTGTVVIQNTGEEDSVLSITNLKWTFSQYGGKGYFRIPTPVEDDMLMVASTDETPAAAYSLMRMRTAALDVEQSAEPEVSTDADGNSIVSITLNTSSDVASLVITDENGNPVPPEQLEYFAAEREEDGIIEWTVNITVTDSGNYTFTVAGAYANGYTDMSKAVTVTVTVEEPQPDEEPDEDLPDNSGDSDDETTAGGFFEALAGVYRRLIEFFRALLAIFGIAI